MMINNKKGYSTGLFAFFFILVVMSGILMFTTVGVHLILADYAIDPVKQIGQDLIGNAANPSYIALDTLANDHLGIVNYADYLFLFFIVVLFVESVMAAINTKTESLFSFMGFATLGNIILLFLLGYATQMQGWILNEIVYKILLNIPNTPIMTSFFDYSLYIISVWYLILLAVNRLDLQEFKEKFGGKLFNNGNEQMRFEE